MGYGSGGSNRKHSTVESCVRISAGDIHAAGLFGPGEHRANFWAYVDGEKQPSCVVFCITGKSPAEIWLIVWPGASWQRVVKLAESGGINPGMFDGKQCIQISETACNYGALRYWLHCPKCNKRVFRLFYHKRLFINGEHRIAFYCRHCLELTYIMRQSRGFWLQQIRVGKLKGKLIQRGAEDSDGIAWRAYLPDRPKGMKMARYEWLAERFEDAADELRGAFVGDMKRMIKQFDGK